MVRRLVIVTETRDISWPCLALVSLPPWRKKSMVFKLHKRRCSWKKGVISTKAWLKTLPYSVWLAGFLVRMAESIHKVIPPSNVMSKSSSPQTWHVMGEAFDLPSKFKVVDYLGAGAYGVVRRISFPLNSSMYLNLNPAHILFCFSFLSCRYVLLKTQQKTTIFLLSRNAKRYFSRVH